MQVKLHRLVLTLTAFGALLFLLAAPVQAARGGRGNSNGRPAAADEAKQAGQPLDDDAVRQAIDRAIEYFWKTQDPKTNGWESYTLDQFEKDLKVAPKSRELHSPAGIYSAQTALILFSMLKAGVSQDDPRFQKALKFVLEIEPTQTYAHACRAALFASLGNQKQFGPLVEREKEWLLRAMYANGVYTYYAPDSLAQQRNTGATGDLSNTQYGILGMWLISDSHLVEVPEKYWRLVQSNYVRLQAADGGWGYDTSKAPDKGYESMTLGGVASLYIVWDRLYTQKCDQAPDPELVKAVERGMDWLTKNFSPTENVNTPHSPFLRYTIYNVERVGVASGMKYFGEKNWWDLCSKFVLSTQKPEGSWEADYRVQICPDQVSTAWMVLFLSYGRAPVVFNKLEYGGSKQWNTRPRELARLTGWMSKTYERLFNWQIMPIERPLDELLDAPVLYLSGKTPIRLNAEQKAKLKDYVLSGGTLLGDSDDKRFLDSFRSLVRELFPELELAALPQNHPLYTVQFPLNQKRWPPIATDPTLEGLSNGIRAMVLLSSKDLGCTWQQAETFSKRSSFELGANLAQYVSDKGSGLLGRGRSYAARDLGHKPPRQLTVGRVVWGNKYNWDPEPHAWKRMDVQLRNANVLGVATVECDFAAAVDPKAVPLVHLTGVAPVQLSAEQKANLKKYVADGGLLLADAAGGSPKFVESFQKLAEELFGPLKPASPTFLAEATDGGKVGLRHIGSPPLPRSTRPLELLGCPRADGGWGVLFVPYDLTAAMAGYPNSEPAGLVPAAAEKFVAALLKSLPTGVPTAAGLGSTTASDGPAPATAAE